MEGQGECFAGCGGKQRDKEWGPAFFVSVFNNETTCSQGTELEERGKEQHKAPIIQEGMVSGRLKLTPTQVHGVG